MTGDFENGTKLSHSDTQAFDALKLHESDKVFTFTEWYSLIRKFGPQICYH